MTAEISECSTDTSTTESSIPKQPSGHAPSLSLRDAVALTHGSQPLEPHNQTPAPQSPAALPIAVPPDVAWTSPSLTFVAAAAPPSLDSSCGPGAAIGAPLASETESDQPSHWHPSSVACAAIPERAVQGADLESETEADQPPEPDSSCVTFPGTPEQAVYLEYVRSVRVELLERIGTGMDEDKRLRSDAMMIAAVLKYLGLIERCPFDGQEYEQSFAMVSRIINDWSRRFRVKHRLGSRCPLMNVDRMHSYLNRRSQIFRGLDHLQVPHTGLFVVSALARTLKLSDRSIVWPELSKILPSIESVLLTLLTGPASQVGCGEVTKPNGRTVLSD